MKTKFEVVEYRSCDCGAKDCPGEKEIVLFQHKDKPMCIEFMLKESMKEHVIKTKHYTDTKDKIDIFILVGKLQGIKRLRVQK